ncbi:MAG: zinc finger domain-containing protein [Candidatus Woesearchaeota archaeon]
MKCISCGIETKNDVTATKFPCPQCGYEIVRCGKCRKKGTKYICPKCNFEGPN